MVSPPTSSLLVKNVTHTGPITKISSSRLLTKQTHGRVTKFQRTRPLTFLVSLNGRSLHVNIHDAEKSQFTIPNTVVGVPLARTSGTHRHSSDLVFNYVPSPFSFWITRRSDPRAFPLFDTRISSLPKTPVSAVIPDIPSTSLDAFPLVFEDQYLQVCID